VVEATRLRVSTPVPKVRVRVLPSLLPSQMELQNTGTEIQWRLVGDDEWQTLILISDLLPLPADILAELLTVDGSDSGLDADFLDGLDSTVFERAVAGVRQLVAATGTTAVAADTSLLVVNLGAPGSVTLTLPATSARAKKPLKIVDWGGNATITLTPDAADTGGILGLSSGGLVSSAQGLGTAASILLIPDTALLGWLA
jgi:hypothetical protein